MYNISVDEIKMSNGDSLNKGLQVGQIVKIPGTKTLGIEESTVGSAVTPSASIQSEQTNSVNEALSSAKSKSVSHKVEPKETLYSLSKKYNVTVDDIKAQNPEVAQHGLQIGQILKIETTK